MIDSKTNFAQQQDGGAVFRDIINHADQYVLRRKTTPNRYGGAGMNSPSESKGSKESNKRNQKIQAKQRLQTQHHDGSMGDIVGAHEGMYQMKYIEKKDLETDMTLKHQANPSFVEFTGMGPDEIQESQMNSNSISSFLRMSIEKLPEKVQRTDSQNEIQILKKTSDHHSRSQTLTGITLGQAAHRPGILSPSDHQASNLEIEAKNNKSHLVPHAAGMNSISDHEEQDEIDLLMCSEKAADFTILNEQSTIYDAHKNEEGQANTIAHYNSPDQYTKRENQKSQQTQAMYSQFLSFGKDMKSDQNVPVMPPQDTIRQLKIQEDSANVNTIFGAENLNDTRNTIDSRIDAQNHKIVGDFQDIVVQSNQAVFTRNKIHGGQNELNDLDQDLEIEFEYSGQKLSANLHSLNMNHKSVKQSPQFTNQIQKSVQGQQKITNLKSKSELSMASKNSNRSQEIMGNYYKTAERGLQPHSSTFNRSHLSSQNPSQHNPNRTTGSRPEGTKSGRIGGRKNSAANTPYRSLSLQSINCRYVQTLASQLSHSTSIHGNSCVFANGGDMARSAQNRTSVNQITLQNCKKSNNSNASQNSHNDLYYMNDKSSKNNELFPSIQILKQKIQKSPAKNQQDIQMALINSIVLDQKSPAGKLESKDSNPTSLPESLAISKEKSSRTSAGKGNFSLKVDTKCKFGTKEKEQDSSVQANGPLKSKFQKLTLEGKQSNSKQNCLDFENLDMINQSASQEHSLNQLPSSRASRTIEKLKSPRPDKLLARAEAMAATEAMGLLEDALGGDGLENSFDDDDSPFDPYANKKIERYNQDNKIEIYASSDKIDNNFIQANITKNQDLSQKPPKQAENQLILVQDKLSQKDGCKDQYQQILSASEGLTDLGESPQRDESKPGYNAQSQVANGPKTGSLRLKDKEKAHHHYDPHEPHSAQNFQIRGQQYEVGCEKCMKRQATFRDNSDSRGLDFGDSPVYQSPEKNQDDEENGFLKLQNVHQQELTEQNHAQAPILQQSEMIDNNFGANSIDPNDYDILQEQSLQCQDVPLIDEKSSSSKEQMEEENEDQDEQEDEVGLVDDGFFENLMNKQKPNSRRYEILTEDAKEMNEEIAQQSNQQNSSYGRQSSRMIRVDTNSQNQIGGYTSLEHFPSISGHVESISYGKEFSKYLKNQENISPIDEKVGPYQQQQQEQQSYQYPVNLNVLIREHVQKTYFPQATQNFEFFEQMLIKEQKQLQFNLLNENMGWDTIFQRQPDLSAEMRLILLDWMCQVCSDYCLKRQTYHLAVQYTDAYFQRCHEHIETQDFQLIGVTCLHMAAKIEEIYPPHIRSFAESTNDSVTTDQIVAQEYKVCALMNWNFEQFITYHTWATWFMKRWDEYVDESLSYLKQQFQLKFLEGKKISHQKFLTFMQFVDIIAIDYESKKYTSRVLVACIMYLILGGKDIMCAFQIEYKDMLQAFNEQFPIIDPNTNQINTSNIRGNGPCGSSDPSQQRLPEGILFYNQIIQPFFVKEFGFYLHELIEPLKFVLKFFILDIEEGKQVPEGLIQQCKYTLKQHDDIALEKVFALQEQDQLLGLPQYRPGQIQFKQNYIKEYTDEDVYLHVNEFFSYQTYNSQILDTLKFICQLDTNSQDQITSQVTAQAGRNSILQIDERDEILQEEDTKTSKNQGSPTGEERAEEGMDLLCQEDAIQDNVQILNLINVSGDPDSPGD